MCTIVIADDDLLTVKNIFNYVMQRNSGIIIIEGLTDNGYELLDLINRRVPDILLLDLMMPKLNGIQVLDNLIENKKIYLKEMKIIIISSYIDKLYQEDKYREYIYEVLQKPYDVNMLISIIERINTGKEKIKMEQYIERELNKFNFNRGSNSYRYLRDTIYLILSEGRKNFELESDIYSKIAKLNNKKNEKIIKWNIEKLIYNMYMNTRFNIIKEYFDFKEDIKPTTKMFIRKIVENYNLI